MKHKKLQQYDPEQIYTLKPLVWKGSKIDCRAYTLFGSYSIDVKTGDDDYTIFIVSWCFSEYYDEGTSEHSTIKEAKAWAQADYFFRIKNALKER